MLSLERKHSWLVLHASRTFETAGRTWHPALPAARFDSPKVESLSVQLVPLEGGLVGGQWFGGFEASLVKTIRKYSDHDALFSAAHGCPVKLCFSLPQLGATAVDFGAQST